MLKQKSTLPGNFILFGGVLNQAYLELTMNWLCNIYGLPKIKKIGKNNKKRLINLNEGNIELLNVTLFVGLDSGKICSQIIKKQKALDEPLSWGRLRYVQILNARAQLLSKLGEESIPFVLAESDAIWLRNPFEELFPNLNSLDDVDLVLPLNSQSGTIKGQRFAFDPMFAFATNATILALQRMNKLLNGENSSISLMDQDVLNQLCFSQYSGLVCRDFDRSDIADGAWLKLSETERLRAAKKFGHWPYIVNNNFYVGVHNKMAR
ncbi:unnamed protein product [Meloidogyne enterolobii]|uniref:Uncharacterized protein n=1 Tax=Meloidogyne enterolobii TaxID=390850 RepID=A0ACB0XWR2_MELEN